MKSVPRKLLLAGFSGAGKSTVLRELANLGAQEFAAFLDLDVLTRGDAGDVASFVARHGWDKFRAEELAQLEKILQGSESAVVALGGGTLERAWPVIKKYSDTQVCHLDVSFSVAWQRLAFDTEERPLASAGQEAMAALFLRRQGDYQKAHFSVNAARPPREVAMAILKAISLA